VARTAGPKVAPRMIRGVLRGDLLLTRPWAQALVALGGCGFKVPTVAASFPASGVTPGVSAGG